MKVHSHLKHKYGIFMLEIINRIVNRIGERIFGILTFGYLNVYNALKNWNSVQKVTVESQEPKHKNDSQIRGSTKILLSWIQATNNSSNISQALFCLNVFVIVNVKWGIKNSWDKVSWSISEQNCDDRVSKILLYIFHTHFPTIYNSSEIPHLRRQFMKINKSLIKLQIQICIETLGTYTIYIIQ